jgi:hypothetical protein
VKAIVIAGAPSIAAVNASGASVLRRGEIFCHQVLLNWCRAVWSATDFAVSVGLEPIAVLSQA